MGRNGEKLFFLIKVFVLFSRRREWLTLINRQDLLQKENLNHISYVLCSAHFEDSSIIIVKRLNENAVPTLLLPKKFEEKVPIVAEEIIKEGKVYEEVIPTFFLTNEFQGSSSSSKSESRSTEIKKKVVLLPEENSKEVKNISKLLLPNQSQVDSSHSETQSTSAQIHDEIIKEGISYDPTVMLPNQSERSLYSSETQFRSSEINKKVTILSDVIIKKGSCCSDVQSASTDIKNKVLPNNKESASIETQTEALQSKEEQTQTSKSLSDGTPRKRKILEETRECKLKCRRLDKEIMKIKKELEAKNPSITCNDPDIEVERRFQKLIEWQNKLKNKYKGNRYDAEYKVFALNLLYSSPQAYRCLKTILKLPCKSTLNRLKMNIPPKLDDRVLDSLALKIKYLPDEAKFCTICVDEMTLKRNLYYDIKNDEVIGFHNVNGTTSPDIASNAYVIMLQGIYCKWKQPLAYALLATAKHYEALDIMMNEIITKLSAIGIKLKAIVSDQGSNFDKFAKEVKKITVEKPYFIYDDIKIFYIFDVPHLIKCIRNNLIQSDFIDKEGNIISWKYIEELYINQKERNLRLIPKITDAHVTPTSFQKMRVKLAAQILSRTVSAALHTYIDLGLISEEARPTAAFIELMNNLFDVLNSSKIKSCNKFQTAFRLSKDQEKVLNDSKEMLSTTKAINRKSGKNNTGHIKSFVNFQISIESIKMLYEDLKKDGFDYLLTRRLNQDNLENFFGAVRQQGGSCSEPTPIQFQRAFSKLFLCNMLKSSPNANCEMDICEVLLKVEDIMKTPLFGTNSPPQTSAICLMGETDYRMDLPDENCLTYVAGYLLYKCSKEHNCSELRKQFETLPELGNTNLFSRYKEFNKNSAYYSSLKLPPKEFLQYVQNLEKTFIENFENCIQRKPGCNLLQLFQKVPPQTPCSCFPTSYLLKLFARFRIFATIKFNNRQFKEGKKGIKKYVKVSHL